MPAIPLDASDSELAEMLQFPGGWLAAEDILLSPSLTRFVGSDAYGLSQLRAYLDRFAFLLDGTGGESLFNLSSGDG